MDQLLDKFHEIVAALSHGNTMAAGLVTMWLLTVGGILLRRVPRAVYWKIRRKIVVSMVLDKTTSELADERVPNGNVVQYGAFLKWVADLPSARFDRNRKPNFDRGGSAVMELGFGGHWFWFENRFYWFYRRELDSQGVGFQKERITLYTIGWSLAPLERLIDVFKHIPNKDVLKVYSASSAHRNSWEVSAMISVKDHPKPLVDEKIQRDVFDRVQEFLANEAWYRERGIAYKCTFMLMGPPGTGKTTIARELAIMFKLNLHVLNLAGISSREFELAVARFKKGIILVDDLDDTPALLRRDLPVAEGETKPFSRPVERPGLASFLSFLDGAVPLDNAIVILCTNYPEKLDPAIHRPGRVDYKIVVGPMQPDTVRLFIDRMYKTTYEGELKPTNASALHGLFNRNKWDYDQFMTEYHQYHAGELDLMGLEYDGLQNSLSPEK